MQCKKLWGTQQWSKLFKNLHYWNFMNTTKRLGSWLGNYKAGDTNANEEKPKRVWKYKLEHWKVSWGRMKRWTGFPRPTPITLANTMNESESDLLWSRAEAIMLLQNHITVNDTCFSLDIICTLVHQFFEASGSCWSI